jgi:CRP-like cAMP-binding protein
MMIDIDLLLTMGGIYKELELGDVIFYEDNKCNFYYQLVKGKVKWSNFNDEGKEYLQLMVEPGESFGELPLFDNLPYAATAIAAEKSLIIKLNKATFHQLLIDHPEIHMDFSKLFVERLRFKFFMLKDLMNKEPEERIMALIKYLSQNHHNVCDECGLLKLTRQEIANMTCLRVETVIRAVKNMQERGELNIKKGKVFLK